MQLHDAEQRALAQLRDAREHRDLCDAAYKAALSTLRRLESKGNGNAAALESARRLVAQRSDMLRSAQRRLVSL
jgi:hypothetical protein